MSKSIIGKTITDLLIAKDKEALRFVTTDGDVVARCDADCCSYTWVESVELPALGFPAAVLAVENLDLPGSQDNHPDFDCLQVYGCKIITDRGEIIIDYRNSSNGYYGGNLCWPEEGDYFYGGVYGQNNSKEEWAPIAEVLS